MVNTTKVRGPILVVSVFLYHDDGSMTDLTGKAFLFEPGKAMMKAGAYNLVSTRMDISKLGKSTHCYTTSDPSTADVLIGYGKVFQILEYSPLDKRGIKETGKNHPKAEVTARNIPMTSDALRKKLGCSSGGDVHIFGLRSDTKGNLLIICKRI